MIVCNKCGCNNENAALSCVTCGHKLQSLRGPTPGDDNEVDAVPLAEEEIDYRDLLGRDGYFRKHLEVV